MKKKVKVFVNCELEVMREIKGAYITNVEISDSIVVIRAMKESKGKLHTMEYQISNGMVYERVE